MTDYAAKKFNLVEDLDIEESIKEHLGSHMSYRITILKENYVDHLFLYKLY